MTATPPDRSQPMEKWEFFMFLPQVSEFVEFLSLKDHTLEEFLAHMVLRALAPIDATSAFVSELSRENVVAGVGSFGIAQKSQEKYPRTFDLRDKYPLTDAIRNRSVVWINTLPQWPDEYPVLRDLAYDTGERTFICFPIEKCGTPIAALGIFCKSVVEPDVETETYLRAIGNIFSLQLYRNSDSPSEELKLNGKRRVEARIGVSSELSERQLIILRMMSERRTNTNIGELLGYSESTIRQETIRIFALLNCRGREEASEIYRDKFALDSQLAG